MSFFGVKSSILNVTEAAFPLPVAVLFVNADAGRSLVPVA